jgi:acetyl esterase/lipase
VEVALPLTDVCRRINRRGIKRRGGLAAGLSLLARDRAKLRILIQCRLYTMLDDRNETASSWESNSVAWQHYFGSASRADVSAYAAPAHAVGLSASPPTYIAVGALDPLCE